jgi:peptidoglycan/LPS O-acetylase OafA/YrhL
MVGRWATYDPAGSFLGPYVSTLTRLDTILVGLALAAAFRRGDSRRVHAPAGDALTGDAPAVRGDAGRGRPSDRVGAARASAVAAGAGAIWLLVVARRVPLTSTWLYHWGLDANALAVAALIAHLVRRPTSVGARLLSTTLVRWLRARSYGLYLYHYGLFLAVQHHLHAVRGWWAGGLAVALAVLAAEASYRVVERPARRLLLDHGRAG